MSPARFDPPEIDTSGDITLVLGQRTASVRGHRVRMHNDVSAELRAICEATLDKFADRQPVAYTDDLDIDRENQYLEVPIESMTSHKPESLRGKRVPADTPRQMVEVDPASLKVLTEASSHGLLDARQIGKKSFLFYAAVVGDDPHDRVAFVSHWNPYKAALSSRLLTWFGDGLHRVEGPLLAFQTDFDMVITSDTVAVLNPTAFEKVFRDIDAMRDRIPTWSAAVSDALPVDEVTAAVINEACATSARIAKQARGIYERGIDKKFTPAELCDEMARQGLDVDRMIKNGKLILDRSDVPEVLKLIDEKLYKGWHSGTGWDVGSRSPRQ